MQKFHLPYSIGSIAAFWILDFGFWILQRIDSFI